MSKAPIHSAFGWAYPTSEVARQFGRSESGCWIAFGLDEDGFEIDRKGPFESASEAEAERRRHFPLAGSAPSHRKWMKERLAAEHQETVAIVEGTMIRTLRGETYNDEEGKERQARPGEIGIVRMVEDKTLDVIFKPSGAWAVLREADARNPERYQIGPFTVTINRDPEYAEYRVPAPDGREAGAAYTCDKEDAEGTARMMWGDDVKITFRSGRHPKGKA